MRIVFLTRTSRPSGALVAQRLIEGNKDVVAIVAEERSQLLKKKGGKRVLLFGSIKEHGLDFILSRMSELMKIKFHFILRKIRLINNAKFYSIEEFSLKHKKIPYFLVKDHNSKQSEEIIRSFSPDLIVITNTRLLHKNILNIPKRGCINLHGSMLPKYAGLDSVFWALFYGEKEVGVTVHFVNEELDRGEILLQKEINIETNDNERTLYTKALDAGSRLMVEAVTQMENNKANPIRQDMSLASKFSWPTKEQRRLLRKKLRVRRHRQKKHPIKILHIITRLIRGGAQENTLLTVLGLRSKGYRVMLASGPSKGAEGEIESVAREKGVDLAIIPELTRQVNPIKDFVSLVKLYRLIKQNNFDIVHTHTSKAGILGRLAAKLAGTPIIVHTPHGHIFYNYFNPLETKAYQILEMISSCFCDKIITLTDKCKQEHIRRKIAPADKFVTIHSGVELERFSARAFDNAGIKKEFGIPAGRKIVGTVARLEPIKGVNFFIESIRDVLKASPDTHFLIVGDGKERAGFENRVRELAVDRYVTFTGIREDVPRLLSIMDLFVLCSLNEGMGRVLVEAGIMSKPVVATNVSGIPELIKDGSTGILVEPANAEELSRKIIELLSNPDKARALGENARTFLQDNFSARRMVDKIEELYRYLM